MKLEVFVRRHEFCIPLSSLAAQRERARRTMTHWPTKGVSPVCDHPKDGYCIDELQAAIKDGFIEVIA